MIKKLKEKNNTIIAKYNNWDIYCEKTEGKLLNFAENIIENKNIKVLKELKNSKRSQVLLIEELGRKFILKTPRMKHNLFRMKMLTLFMKGEALSSFYKINNIRAKGFDEVFKPIMAMERRKKGMVQDSWLLYEYVDGEKCLKEAYPLIVNTLEKFHRLGYRHSDANIANFIYKDKKAIMIDCRGKTNLFWKFGEYDDYLLLKKSAKGIEEYFPFSEKHLIYRISKFNAKQKINIREISNAIRRFIKKILKSGGK